EAVQAQGGGEGSTVPEYHVCPPRSAPYPVRSDDEVVEAIAVDVPRTADGLARRVILVGAVDGETIAPVESAESQGGREGATVPEYHVGLPGTSTAWRTAGCCRRPDDEVI